MLQNERKRCRKRQTLFCALSLIFCLVTLLPLNGAAINDTGTTLSLAVSYTTAPANVNPRLLSLDVYAPAKATSAPVMIYFHGGGWKRGDKAAVGMKPAFFNKRGWIFVSANYRLIPDGRHPVNAEDVGAAAGWVHNHIASHGGDSSNIFLMGHSAGAHLVALVGTDERHLAKAGLSLADIRGVIALDSQGYNIPQTVRQSRSDIYRTAFTENITSQMDASPLHHVAPGKNIPPFLIPYSGGMTLLPSSRQRARAAEEFANALRNAGTPALVLDATDRNHMEINKRFGDPTDEKVTSASWRFLQENLR
jgi:acetyl esterase/lipase